MGEQILEMREVDTTYIDVRDSDIHGQGVYAARDIPKGAKVIEYVGKKVTKAEADEIADRQMELSKGNEDVGAVYLFELDDVYDIDGNVDWNPARFINHSCDPNCEVEIDEGRIWIMALRDIKKGEEISYDYGYDIENFQDHPCRCGAKNCAGYIVDKDERHKISELLKAEGDSDC